MMKVPSTAAHTSPLTGMSVRDTAHAIGTPHTVQTTCTARPMTSELISASTCRQRPEAPALLARVKAPVSGCWKLAHRRRASGLITSRSSSAIRSSQTTKDLSRIARRPASDPEGLPGELFDLRDALLDLDRGGPDRLDLRDGLAARHRLHALVYRVLILRDHHLVALAAQQVLDEEPARVGGGRVLQDAGGGDHEHRAVLGIDHRDRVALGPALQRGGGGPRGHDRLLGVEHGHGVVDRAADARLF